MTECPGVKCKQRKGVHAGPQCGRWRQTWEESEEARRPTLPGVTPRCPWMSNRKVQEFSLTCGVSLPSVTIPKHPRLSTHHDRGFVLLTGLKGESPNCTELVLSRAAWAASLHGREHCEACVRGKNPRQDRKLEPSSERSHNLLPPHWGPNSQHLNLSRTSHTQTLAAVVSLYGWGWKQLCFELSKLWTRIQHSVKLKGGA